jgi:hypothetical protein
MSQKVISPGSIYLDSFSIAFLICLTISTGFLASSHQFLHWFIIPVIFCGTFIGADAVNWFRGRLQLFDPVGILGVLGLHFFFLAPLLHIHWDFWLRYINDRPDDWRPWLGGMAILNFLGILVYRHARGYSYGPQETQASSYIWKIRTQRFFIALGLSLTITFALQMLVYQSFGGIVGYMASATDIGKSEAFEGKGLIFMLSESFPILAMIGFAVYSGRHPSMRNWIILGAVLIIFILLQLLFGGLRGSRSNTIFSLIWVVGIIHLWLRPISRKAILIGFSVIVVFMYFYGFYKNEGLDGVQQALQDGETKAALVERTGRSHEVVILQDLGRSDIQAFLLYRLLSPKSDYEYAWGRTYFASAALFIPKAVWPDRPPLKHKEGTDAQYGMNSYQPAVLSSSNVYGLAGETMLNFGPLLVPASFVFLGLIVQRIRYFQASWDPSDARQLILPILVVFCFIFLVSDSDNCIVFLIKNSSLPLGVLWISCDKQKKELSSASSIPSSFLYY